MNMPLPLLSDIALILVSGSACVYCGILNRRLKALHNLKSGVGASIISLTEAITETNKAAKDAQSSTLQTVETLRHLLEKSESAAPKIEAGITELERACKRAEKQQQDINLYVDDTLMPAVEQSRKTAMIALQSLALYEKHVPKSRAAINPNESQNKTAQVESAPQSAPAKQGSTSYPQAQPENLSTPGPMTAQAPIKVAS